MSTPESLKLRDYFGCGAAWGTFRDTRRHHQYR
jgi:hypothetical protein